MANPEHLEILKQGVKVWNQWRDENSEIIPDLSNFRHYGLMFDEANLSNVNLQQATLVKFFIRGSNLKGAKLTRGHFVRGYFNYSNLSGANFNLATFTAADFIESQLENAKLTDAAFTLCYLNQANLQGTDLSFTTFRDSTFIKASFDSAKLDRTIFGSCNLRDARGLETCKHNARSIIDHRTLISSKLPLLFLRGCGLSDTLIEYIPSLMNDPLQFYSCFISYSSKNQLFADRLYADLQNKGVRCWLASEDLKIGDKIRVGIDESIRFHDKLLLVLSKHSVSSDWVEQEVETALDRERKEKRTVLFPIRLDDTVMKIDTGWPALIKNTRNIGDFRKWKNHDSYQKAFDRLLRDLKAEEQ